MVAVAVSASVVVAWLIAVVVAALVVWASLLIASLVAALFASLAVVAAHHVVGVAFRVAVVVVVAAGVLVLVASRASGIAVLPVVAVAVAVVISRLVASVVAVLARLEGCAARVCVPFVGHSVGSVFVMRRAVAVVTCLTSGSFCGGLGSDAGAFGFLFALFVDVFGFHNSAEEWLCLSVL